MRNLITIVLLAGASLAANAAPGRTHDLAELRGQYDLKDGSLLTITESRHTLYARLDDGSAIPLSWAGPSTLADRSGQLRIEFKQAANGSVSGVTVTRSTRP